MYQLYGIGLLAGLERQETHVQFQLHFHVNGGVHQIRELCLLLDQLSLVYFNSLTRGSCSNSRLTEALKRTCSGDLILLVFIYDSVPSVALLWPL